MGKFKTNNFEEIKSLYRPIPLSSKSPNTIDITNSRFGHLVAIYPTHYPLGSSKRAWVCKCDCGIYKCVNTSNLLNGDTNCCGPACIYKKRKTHDLTNKKFGRLTVLEAVGPNKYGYMQWRCKCDCSNETTVIAKYLETGRTMSCGACPDQLKSKGNSFIHEWLIAHDINFKTEVRFEDCRYKYPLPFDFVIYDESGKIIQCIEYQGNIHYVATGGWITEEHVEEVKKRDAIKCDYCKEHEIKLLVIPYTEFNNLSAILEREVL